MKTKIISISGLDGSGKTTQLELLQKYLRSRGNKIFYFHAVEFSIAQKVRKFFTGRKRKKEKLKSVIAATKNQVRLRKIAFLIDAIRFKFLLKKLEKQGYDFLVSDRFFYDNIVNISYLLHKNCPPKIERCMPVADLAFYLRTEPEDIMKRRRVPEQGVPYLIAKKNLYDTFSSMWNLIVIDGNRQIEEIFREITLETRRKLAD